VDGKRMTLPEVEKIVGRSFIRILKIIGLGTSPLVTRFEQNRHLKPYFFLKKEKG
jgi:hypothetical protein